MALAMGRAATRPVPETLNIDLGYRPYQWQYDCHRHKRQYTVLVVHRQAGKTELALQELMQGTYPYPGAITIKSAEARFAYVAPQLKQAKLVMWDRLKAVAKLVPGNIIREADCYVEMPNAGGGRSRVYLLGADDPDNIRGMTLDGAVPDEVAKMKADTWDAVLSIALMKRKGWAVFIGTVRGIDLLSKLYFKAKNGSLGKNWLARIYTADETGVFTAEEIAEKKQNMPDAKFRCEFMCDFSAAAENQLISLEAVMASQKRAPPKEAFEWAPKIMGVDVAFSPAGDRSVITCRQGSLVYQPEIYRGIDNMQLVDKVSLRHRVFEPDALFVDKGRGEGVIARLRQLGYPVIGVDFGGKVGDPRFRRKKDEMIVTCADAVRDEWALPDMEEYRVEGPSMTCHFQATTDKLYVEYDPVLPSPDVWVSLALTVAHPVNVRRGPGASLYGRQRRRTKADDNPLKTMLGER